MRRRSVIVGRATLCGLLLSGCRTSAPERVRQEHAVEWGAQLQEETRRVLDPAAPPLDLAACQRLARERSLVLTRTKLSERLTELYRNAAFSTFLPMVTLEYGDVRQSEPPERRIPNGSMVMSDQRIRHTSAQITYPVFAPNAWLLYFSARRGVAIQKLVRERAEETLDLRVAAHFFEVAAAGEQVRMQEAVREAVMALDRDVGALVAAGYAMESDRARLTARRLQAERECEQALRGAELARGRLLETLNLWPLAEARVDTTSLLRASEMPWPNPDTPGASPDLPAAEAMNLPLEAWLHLALVRRRELWAMDQAVALTRTETWRALALFLPTLAGFANHYDTSDSFTIHQAYWGTGFAATMSVFTGFRTVQEYRMARERHKAAFEEREARALNIMLQVMEARKNWLDAQRQYEMAAAAARAAALDYEQARRRQEEGREVLAVVLEQQSAQVAAAASVRLADYQRALAGLVFRHAVGLPGIPSTDKETPAP